MKAKTTLAILLLNFICLGLSAQIPLVYPVENTGAGCAPPPLPTLSQLPVVQPLPDPFMWANGSGRSTSFSDWECHRNEYKAMIENYEIGIKPPKPDDITATYTPSSATAGVLSVVVKRNGQTLTLTCQVALPAVAGPWPAIIGMNSASGSLPASVFTSRNIARITYSHNNVTTYGNPSLNDPFYKLYPEYNLSNSGQYSAWAWGVSRIIDGLEMVQASLPINLQRIGVTGCSYAGKMALYSGALDERIALTIAQESGGGGAPAWRASHNLEPNGSVEKIDNTDYRWFKDDMVQFAGDNVYKLPHDHHQLMAMVAPRALLVTGNTDFTWLSNKANYVASRATKEIYSTLGISDRFGFYIDGGHNHCAVPNSQVPAVQAFVDKFLAGLPNVITDTVTVHPFPTVDYKRWYQWWGTRTPVLPPLAPEPLGKRIWLEAECANVGANWDVVQDAEASGGKAVVVKPGFSSKASAPTDDPAYVVVPFMTDSAASYNFLARLNVPAGEEYSYWMKIDGGAFTNVASQLAANPGFESGMTGWTILNSNGATITANNNAADAHSGNYSMKVVNPTAWPGNQWRVQVTSTAFPTTVGKQYVISYWVRALSPNGSIRLSTGPSNAQYQADQAIGTSWQKVTWTITASITSTTVVFDMAQVANTYFIDDVSVKEVSTGSGWQWVKVRDAALTAGPHTLTIGYNAGGGTKLDKLLITTSSATITGLGDASYNCGGPVYFSKATGDLHDLQTWGLNADGSGAHPADFNDSTFQLNNRSSGIYSMTGDWTVGGTISIPTGGQLQVGNNTLALAGIGAAGTITGSPTSNLSVIGSNGGNVTLNFTPGNNMLNNLTLNRSGAGAALALGNAVNVYGVLTLTSGTLNAGGMLTLKSTADNTARVAPVASGSSVTGAVTVERYIPARRAWRILSAPVGGSQTINQGWQEGAILGTADAPNPAPGYGTFITGGQAYGSTANGFDQGAPGSATSIKYYNSVLNNWVEQPNTNATAIGSNAFMVFVRGDRGLPLTYNTMPPTPTTLRTSGTLKTGDQIFGVNGSGFTAIPNPFASPINFATITRSNVQNNFYVWDPKMGTSGAYVLISYNGSSYDVVPASVSPESQYIQSGQGFLVRPTTQGLPGYIVIKESDKTATPAQDVFRATGSGSGSGKAPVMADPSAGQSIRITLKATADGQVPTVADEVFVSYKKGFSDKVDLFDAAKPENLQENLGLVSESQTLMAERRAQAKEGDVLKLKIWNMTPGTYSLSIQPIGMLGLGLSAVLEDRYLNTSTPITLLESTDVAFRITSDPASARTDRFQLRIVKAGIETVGTEQMITAFPNPVVARTISLRFRNQPAGTYNVTLVNSIGQVVYRKAIQHAGGTALQTIQLEKVLAKGAYQLTIAGQKETTTISLMSSQ